MRILGRDNWTCQWPGCGRFLIGKPPAPDSPVVHHKQDHKGDLGLFLDPENAEALGYSDAVAMNEQHDALHSLIAHWLGTDASPTLKGVASGKHYPNWREEENVVFAIAAYANAAGVDLVARRWSDG